MRLPTVCADTASRSTKTPRTAFYVTGIQSDAVCVDSKPAWKFSLRTPLKQAGFGVHPCSGVEGSQFLQSSPHTAC